MNVAFIIFRRPDLTEKVFEAITRARPERLFVIADGPRNEEERPLCEAARRITEKVDWPCEVSRNYSETNLGCKVRVSSGLSWVFDHVEEAIILEDDCLPDPSFFRYCTELLERYRFDGRVGHIGANCFLAKPSRGGTSYRFSRYAMIWGWATWRRAWKLYDVTLSQWPELRKGRWDQDMLPTLEEAAYLAAWWDDLHANNEDNWDGQWIFNCLVNNLLCIQPEVNLVTNIGFRHDGTHTISSERTYAAVPSGVMPFPLTHPLGYIPDRQADLEFAAELFPIFHPVWKHLWWRVSNRHWYGAIVRKLPLIGRLWSRWRMAVRCSVA